jgi:hypothetical protein
MVPVSHLEPASVCDPVQAAHRVGPLPAGPELHRHSGKKFQPQMHADEAFANRLSKHVVACPFEIINTLATGHVEEDYQNVRRCRRGATQPICWSRNRHSRAKATPDVTFAADRSHW